jgi:lipid II isoglutaminyl synthase (glutamine-hydrolysing)
MKQKMIINIGHLYGSLMNTYGDDGNIIALKKRCEWRGIEVRVTDISLNYKIKKGEFDLYFFGGGQDQSQVEVSRDLVQSDKGKVLKSDLERGVPMLAICGGYQLIGVYYEPQNGPKIGGLGFFPAYTEGSSTRMIGNIVVGTVILGTKRTPESADPGQARMTLVGFENHSGKTYLEKGATPLGKVVKGFGNNGEDGTEGCIKNNAIGCYMHGSLLPKNPELADWLIKKALEVKFGEKVKLEDLDDSLEKLAHERALQKFS